MRAVRIALLTVTILLLGAIVAGVAAYYLLSREPMPWADNCIAEVGGSTVRVDTEQARNAAIIAGVAGRRGLAPRAASIALATAWQESGLRNLDYGDRDSLGLFQQRPSQGWGTSAEVMDPHYAANAFYAALEQVPGWQSADVGDVAQTIQRSGFPDAYDKHVANAKVLASSLTGETPASFRCAISSLPDPDPAGLAGTLTTTLPQSTTITAADTSVTIQAKDARTAWSAAAISVALTADYGVRSVSVADQSWAASWPSSGTWTATDDIGATQVIVRFA